jgi:hypothetical protein
VSAGPRQDPQPGAQLSMTRPHTVTELPQGMVVQSGSVHAVHAPAAVH